MIVPAVRLGFIGLYLTPLILPPVTAVVEKTVQKRSSDICQNVECEPGHQCCEDGEECELGKCQKCISRTFSPGGFAICENCNECIRGTKVLEECTFVNDTVCSECLPGYFRSPGNTCQSCSSCRGEVHCVEICTTTPAPTTSPTPKVSASIDNSKSDVTKTTQQSLPTSTGKKEESWINSYLIPIVCSAVFVVFVLGGMRKFPNIFCCWTKGFKEFWANYCPCFCGTADTTQAGSGAATSTNNIDGSNNTVVTIHGNVEGGVNFGSGLNGQNTGAHIPMQEIAMNGESNPAVSSSDIDTTVPDGSAVGNADGNGNAARDEPDTDPEREPLMNGHRNGGPPQSLSVRRNGPSKLPSKSSLPGLPENDVLSDVTSNEPYVLANWCLHDGTRVAIEHISKVSNHIGKMGITIGGLLGLDGGEMENIEYDHKTNLSRQNLEILKLWMQQKGVYATKKALAKALVDVGRPKVAEHLWPDRILKPVSPTTPKEERTFWKRRKSIDTQFKLDAGFFDSVNWENESSWKDLIQDMQKKDEDFKQLRIACGTVEYKFPELAPLKSCPKFNVDHCADVNAHVLLECPKLRDLVPVTIPADSNCLFSTASLIAYGSVDHCCELRLRTVIELCYHKDHYLCQEALRNCIKAEYALTKIEEDDILNDAEEIESNFEGSVRDTLKAPELFSLQGNSVQLFGLASVLGCNIQSVYPEHNANGHSPLNVLIPPRDKKIKEPETAFIMWSSNKEICKEETFLPNHFVPLLRK